MYLAGYAGTCTCGNLLMNLCDNLFVNDDDK